MLYSFSCRTCNKQHEFVFLASEYDNHVHNDEALDGLHRTELCEKCGTKTLYRHITADTMPQVMGGSRGYKSMEKYWSENPGLVRKHEDEIMAKRAERHRKKTLDNIDKGRNPAGKNQRHKGYKEDKLKLDE